MARPSSPRLLIWRPFIVGHLSGYARTVILSRQNEIAGNGPKSNTTCIPTRHVHFLKQLYNNKVAWYPGCPDHIPQRARIRLALRSCIAMNFDTHVFRFITCHVLYTRRGCILCAIRVTHVWAQPVSMPTSQASLPICTFRDACTRRADCDESEPFGTSMALLYMVLCMRTRSRHESPCDENVSFPPPYPLCAAAAAFYFCFLRGSHAPQPRAPAPAPTPAPCRTLTPRAASRPKRALACSSCPQ